MRLFFILICAWLFAFDLSATPPAGYYLVWGDEFNGTSLDPTKWWCWIGPSESAINTTDTVSVTNGYLTITTYSTNGQNYSAIISANQRFQSDYGYYESSIYFSDKPAEWSAFWIQSPTGGYDIGDPSVEGSEVDICEHRATDVDNADNISNMVQTSVHWDGYVAGQEKTVTSGLIGSGLGKSFHTYGFLWTPTTYSFAFDNTNVWNTTSGHSDRTEFVMFSQEVSSNSWAGITPAGGYGNLNTSTTKMVIDYLRYYAPTTTVFWTGASSLSWTDPNNWLSNMVAGAGNDVVFSYLSIGNYSIPLTQDTSVNSLTIQETAPIYISGSPLTVNGGGIDMVSALNDATIASPLVLGTNQTWKIGPGLQLTVTGAMSGAGNLYLASLGNVELDGSNTCSGMTVISNGTLLITGSMTGPVVVAGGTLTGSGTLTGPVQVQGGILSPGTTMIISNALTLQSGGATAFNVNESTESSQEILGLTSVSYGGALVINNQSGVFAAGDIFKLFDAASYSGTFASISPAFPGLNLGWDTNTLTTDGTLRVVNLPYSQITNVVESRFGNAATGTNNPAYSFVGFPTNTSTVKSSAPGCSANGSSRYFTASSGSFSVTPTLIAGATYSVAVTWGATNGFTYQETASLVVKPTATGVSSTTFPSTTTAFSGGLGNTNSNTWITIGNITPNTTTPTVTFTYVSGLTSGRWYADAVRFVSQLPSPGSMSSSWNGSNVILNWSGNFILQSSTNVSGPYTDVAGPVVGGPYTNAMTNSQQFFRVRQ